LRVTDDAKSLFISGLLFEEASRVDAAVAAAEAMLEGADLDVLREAFRHYVDEVVRMGREPDANELAAVTQAAMLAHLACPLSVDVRRATLEPLRAVAPELTSRVLRWAGAMEELKAGEHAACNVLRAIHNATPLPWMDSIVVDCPVEGHSYGSSTWELGGPH
jgi:hypothetical protein